MSVPGVDSELDALFDYVSGHAGITFPPNRRATAAGGVQRALRRVGAADVGELLDRIKGDVEAFDELMAELTVGETYFFREPGQFEFIRTEVVPRLMAASSGPRVLRAWSAACASGEETYSLAITLREASPGIAHQVVGTDVSRVRLRSAQRGTYKDWSLRGVPAERVARHFTTTGKTHQLEEGARRSVDFKYLNLVEDVFPSIASGIWGMDVVMCRNVLIYFDMSTIERVAKRLLDSLSDDGWLFLGASDPTISDFLDCDVELTGAGVAYRKPTGKRGAVGWAGVAIAADPPQTRDFSHRDTFKAPLPFRDASDPIVADNAARPTPVNDPPTTSPELGAVPFGHASLDEAQRAYAAADYPRAAALAQAAVSQSPGPIAAWTLLVRALANEGKLTEAGAQCARALEEHRTSAELMYLHGVLLGQAGRHRESADAARRAIYLDRTLVVASLLLGGALAKLGDAEGAVRVLTAAERDLSRLNPAEIVPASDGEPAGRLREMARVQLSLAAGGKRK